MFASFVPTFGRVSKQDEESRLDEPLEEADGVDCDVPADDCDLGVTDREGDAFQSEASLRDEIDEAFQPVTTVVVESPVDGLPIPANESADLAIAHPFTRDTVVCIEDDRVWVELFSHEIEERGWKMGAKLCSPATDEDFTIRAIARTEFDELGKPRPRREFDLGKVSHAFGCHFVLVEGLPPVPVRMRRERCQHFKRQVMANDDIPNPEDFGHFLRFYNCTARRSVGGANMSLRDEAVYACDYRVPVDIESTEKYLDSWDRDRLEAKRHLELVRPFALKD